MENNTKICNICGKSFEDNSRNGLKKSCSLECRYKFKIKTSTECKRIKRKNPEYALKQKQHQKEYREKNQEFINSKRREQYRNDPIRNEQCKAQAKRWHHNNLARHKENCHKWHIKNFDKVTEKNMRKRDRTLPAELVRQVYEYNYYTCTYCGKYGGKLTVEHILPVKRGGSDDFYNLSLACCNCNPTKGKKTITEYLLYQQEIS